MPNYQKNINNTREKFEPLWEHVIILARISNFKQFCAYIVGRNQLCYMIF